MKTMNFNWDIRVVLEGYAGDSIKVEKETTARGSSQEDARRNAMGMSFRIVQKDSTLRFDEEPVLTADGRFRDQKMRMKVLIPFDRPFVMTPTFFHGNFNDWQVKDQYREVYDGENQDWKSIRWVMKRDSGLVATNVPAMYLRDSDEDRSENEGDSYGYEENDTDSQLDLGERGENVKQYSARDFDRIEIGGAYSIEIRQGNDFAVAADGPRSDVDDLDVSVRNGTLVVKRARGLLSL